MTHNVIPSPSTNTYGVSTRWPAQNLAHVCSSRHEAMLLSLQRLSREKVVNWSDFVPLGDIWGYALTSLITMIVWEKMAWVCSEQRPGCC